MRDKNLPYIQFRQQVEDQVRKILTKSTKLRRTPVVATPTRGTEVFLRLPKKYHLVRGLAILSWWLPETLKFELLIQFQEKSRKFDTKKDLELKILLHSQESCLRFLFETERYSTHEIFGNLLRDGIEGLETLVWYSRPYHLKRTIRRRGYNDKGSLRTSDRWTENSDWSFTEAQNRKERNQLILDKSIKFIIQYLEKKDI